MLLCKFAIVQVNCNKKDYWGCTYFEIVRKGAVRIMGQRITCFCGRRRFIENTVFKTARSNQCCL